MPDPDRDPIDDALRAHADLGLDPNRETTIVDAVMRRRDAPQPVTPVRRRPAVVLAGTLAAISLAGVAAAATGLWNPSLGDDQRGRPTASQSEVPGEQLDRLSILRRPANATDRDATTESALRFLNSRYEGVRTQRIRAAQPAPAGQRYLLVPVERSDGITDALCL